MEKTMPSNAGSSWNPREADHPKHTVGVSPLVLFCRPKGSLRQRPVPLSVSSALSVVRILLIEQDQPRITRIARMRTGGIERSARWV
jgi:hypothetical protein